MLSSGLILLAVAIAPFVSSWLAPSLLVLLAVGLRLFRFLRSDADSRAQWARARLESALLQGNGRASHLLSGKVVWVVGASSGIGAAVARVVAACGGRVVVSARRQERLEVVAQQCREAGAPEAAVVPLDVTKFETHAAVVESVVKQMGAIDVVVRWWLRCSDSCLPSALAPHCVLLWICGCAWMGCGSSS